MGRGKLRDEADLRRSRAVRKERSRLLIVTEGVQTEVQYFTKLKSHLRATGVDVIGLDIRGTGRDPLHVVNRAVEESERGRLIGAEGGFDAVRCVFDVDDHSRVREAVDKGIRNGLSLAVSNPCFEVWLLWHYEDCRRHVSSEELRKKLRKHGVDGEGRSCGVRVLRFGGRSISGGAGAVRGRCPGEPWIGGLAAH